MSKSRLLLTLLLPFILLQGCSPKSTPEQATSTPGQGTPTHVVVGLDRSSGEEKFRADMGTLADIYNGPSSARDGRLFLTTKNDNGLAVTAVDVASGKAVWSKELTGDDPGSRAQSTVFLLRNGISTEFDASTGDPAEASKILEGSPLAIQDKTVYSATAGELVSLDTESWKENWRLKLAGVQGATVTDEGLIVINPNGFHLVSNEGRVVWSMDTPNQPSGVAASTDAVLVGTARPTLVAANPKSGETLWEKSWDSANNDWARPLASQSTVLFPAGDKMEAFAAKTGEKVWEADGGRYASLDSESGQAFLIDSAGDSLSCVNVDDGKPVWSKKSGLRVIGHPGYGPTMVFVCGVAEK